jgi:uncharacterized protein YlzI (FlbEa/FlbD family)
MQSKFIKLTTETGNEIHINHPFIISVKKFKPTNESQSNTTVVTMMSGDKAYVIETVDEVMKQIKNADKFII